MSNIPPLTHINVPEDIKITNIDLYSKNFCKEFGDINSDTEITKPIPTLDMVINWSNKLEIEQYSGYNKNSTNKMGIYINGEVFKYNI